MLPPPGEVTDRTLLRVSRDFRSTAPWEEHRQEQGGDDGEEHRKEEQQQQCHLGLRREEGRTTQGCDGVRRGGAECPVNWCSGSDVSAVPTKTKVLRPQCAVQC